MLQKNNSSQQRASVIDNTMVSVVIPAFNGVNAGTIVEYKLPQFGTYDALVLTCRNGMTKPKILEFWIEVNGSKSWGPLTVAQLEKMRSYLQQPIDPNHVVIDFMEPRAENGSAEKFLASWPGNVAGVRSLSLMVKVDSTTPAGSNLELVCMKRGDTLNQLVQKVRVQRVSLPFQGKNRIPVDFGSDGRMIKRVFLIEQTAGMIDKISISINNTNLIQEIERADYEHLQTLRGITVLNDTVVYDAILSGDIKTLFNTAGNGGIKDIAFEVWTDAPQTYVDVMTEFIDPIRRIAG
jgi:Viral coat protein P2 N-terminal domain